MEAKTTKLLSVEETAKQVKTLLNAIAQINGIKCPISFRQLKMIVDGIRIKQVIYVNKFSGKISFLETCENNEYIGIKISRWFNEDMFNINIF